MFRLILAICLICGFSVGASFISLTAVIGLSGFWGGMIALILVWLFGIASGMLYIEAFLAVPEANHLTTLCRRLTGSLNASFISVVFLLFSYCSLIVYYIFMYDIFYATFVTYSAQHAFAPHLCILAVTLFLAFLIYLGRMTVLTVIALLFLTFLFSLGFYFYASHPTFSIPKMGLRAHFFYIIFAISSIFNVSFYQNILPTTIAFLNRNRKMLLYALWIGYTFAMFILLMWLWITLRPELYGNFLAASELKSTFTGGFIFLEKLPQLRSIFSFLATFAVIISLLSLAIALKDYFEDAFGTFFLEKKYLRRLGFVVLIFVPTWIFSLLFFNNFLIFNTLFTVIAEYLLAAIFPIQWVWAVRYRLELSVQPILFGGKKMMIAIVFITALLLFVLGTIPIHTIYW